MEPLVEKLKSPTSSLNTDVLQALLTQLKCLNLETLDEHTYWNEMTGLLWYHLLKGLKLYDDQLLCATCFYNILKLSDVQEYFLVQIAKIYEQKIEKSNYAKTSLLISLMYGMFQSSFIQQRYVTYKNMAPVVKKTFVILISLAYDYAWYTYLVFKTISSFNKTIGTLTQEYIFNNANEITMLNLVNHNWENPITGIRDFGRSIFQKLISIMEDYKQIIDEVDKFYWNKAKYLMLTEIIIQENKAMRVLLQDNDWVDGMVHSLYKPGLVSAGADMYFAVLKSLRSEEEWSTLFMEKVITLLTGTNEKGIENFINYWCLVTFKKYPSLVKTILSELEKKGDIGACIYSYLGVMKQGNRRSMLKKEWQNKEFSEFMIQRLEHYSFHIRMPAFEVLCISHGKSLPSKMEYDLIYQYLVNNINSDSTVLRISMLNCLKQFLIKLHTNLLSMTKETEDVLIDEDLRNFCENIQEFIITSLNYDGNYQRKITTIKLCDAIMTHFNEVPFKQPKHTKFLHTPLLEVLMKTGHWKLSSKSFIFKLVNLLKDPADDVRENVVQLLLQHYISDIKNSDFFQHLIEEAFKCLKSKFFFQIFCGQSIMKLIVNILLIHTQSEGMFKTIEDVFIYGYQELSTEYKAKRDITYSIREGKQLHSLISILNAVLFCCLRNQYNLHNIDGKIFKELLEILDGISNQFAWDDEPSTSSDFSKMSDMVEDMIAKSDYVPSKEKDETQISGMHQIVLNCLWLNVKACSELSTLLIKYHSEDTQFNIEVCSKSLGIITHVLETSRHKGVIESAGACLGESTQHLTLLPPKSELSMLPYTLLIRKLNELIAEASRMSSVTRRGAGLSIMVHRIVANDMRRGKPLLYHFVRTILETCNETDDIPSHLASKCDIDNEKDLPKAIYLHFLTKIVADSSLAADMMTFTTTLGELAFINLTSQCWQIRNAALQLYGAFVPKLIGQRKSSGTDEETIATVACDEFRTHLPVLWQYILSELKVQANAEKLQAHSNLVPILNLLANTAKRYTFSYDIKQQEESFSELFQSLISLLNSPIYTVRRLSAKSIYNIFPFEMIFNTIKNEKFMTENLLHGFLMTTANYFKHYEPEKMYTNEFSVLKESFVIILKSRKHSFISKVIFDDIFFVEESNVTKIIEETFLELEKNKNSPGVYLWVNSIVRKLLNKMEWESIPEVIQIFLNQPDVELYCELVYEKLIKESSPPKEILQSVGECLLKSAQKFNSRIIWKILYEISKIQFYVADNNFSAISQYFQTTNFIVDYNIRYILPFVASVTDVTKHTNFVEKITHLVFSWIEKDFEMRYIAALANNEFGKTLHNLKDATKVVVLQTAVILLQDEDEDVRNASVLFLQHLGKVRSPFICLNKVMSFEYLSSVFEQPNEYIPIFCQNITKMLESYVNKTDAHEEYNPFAHDAKNIYIETEALRHLIQILLAEM